MTFKNVFWEFVDAKHTAPAELDIKEGNLIVSKLF